MLRVAVIANVSQPPFNNNLQPPVDAFRKIASVVLVEPHRYPEFIPTGAASPAKIPYAAVQKLVEATPPHLVVCVGGAMYLSPASRRLFPSGTRFVGIALSDPLGLDASLAIAPEFDLFYTQDPQTIAAYRGHGIDARRCDLAVDVEAVHRTEVEIDTDVVFVGKWTPYRDQMLKALADRCRVRIHTHRGEDRWSIPTHPEVDTPELLSRAFSRSLLAVDFARIEQPGSAFDGCHRLTPRPQFAAACGVPSLVEDFPLVREMFEPGAEIATFADERGLLGSTLELLADDELRRTMGRAALRRVTGTHTWDHRVRQILGDVRLEISP